MKINLERLKESVSEIFVLCILFIIILTFYDHTHWNGIEEEEDKSYLKKIFNRYYFITTTISSVGYGDISPKSYVCKFIVSMLHLLVAIHAVNILGDF